MGDDELLTSRDVQRLLRISPTALWRMRRDGVGPQPIHIGNPDARRKTFRYRKADLLQWVRGQQP